MSTDANEVYLNDPALQRKLAEPAIAISEPEYPDYVLLEKYQVRVRTKAIDLMKIKLVRAKFKLPDRPTYEVRLPSGKMEILDMDEEAAKDNPLDTRRWETFMTRHRQAEETQSDRTAITIFFLGTEMIDPLPVGWEVEQELLGIDIPTHPDMKRAHFLLTEASKTDIAEILRCIMGKSGVTEKEIAVAEEAFRGDVHGGEPG